MPYDMLLDTLFIASYSYPVYIRINLKKIQLVFHI